MRIWQWFEIESSEDRVARGAAFLDHHYPGWEHQVNPDTINLYSDRGCVLGQISYARSVRPCDEAGFSAELDRHARRIAGRIEDIDEEEMRRWAFARGFVVSLHGPFPHPIRRENLVWCWRREIECRRAERPQITVSPEVQTRLQAGVV